MVARLQTKASQIGNILQTLEKKYESKMERQQLNSNGHHQQQQQHHHQFGDKSTASSSCSTVGTALIGCPLSRRQLNLLKFEQMTQKQKHHQQHFLMQSQASSASTSAAGRQRLHIKIDAIPPFNPNGVYQKSPTTNSAEMAESNQNPEGRDNETDGVKIRANEHTQSESNGYDDHYGNGDHDLQTPLSAKSLKLDYEPEEITQSLDTKSLQQMPSF